MACKKSELVSIINSFGAAKASGDMNLIQISGRLLTDLIETIDFEPEDNTQETNDDQPEQSS